MHERSPDQIYIVSQAWYERMETYLLASFKTESDSGLLKVVDWKHLAKKHPGEIANRHLLKRFSKYVRAPRDNHPDNLVLSRKVRED